LFRTVTDDAAVVCAVAVCVCRISVIILRKFGIAFTALMFNKNPEFQMAVALLVMFGAYALQVRFVPYLSPAEHANIVKDHQRKAAEGVRVHVYLAAQVTEVLARGRKAATFSKTGARSRRLGASVWCLCRWWGSSWHLYLASITA
jgi:hypothetical protein